MWNLLLIHYDTYFYLVLANQLINIMLISHMLRVYVEKRSYDISTRYQQ